MIQFNISRFGKLVRWSLTNDKKYYIKTFLQMLVVLLLIFLFFTCVVGRDVNYRHAYQTCCITMMFMFGVSITIGPSMMFYSMEGKHDKQALMLLPASNFEKYLIRYASWIFLLPCYLVAFFGADVLQYVVNFILGHEHTTFVTSTLVDIFSRSFAEVPSKTILNSAILVIVWLHSFYALGATFFRSRKFNWVLTTIVAILLGVLQAWFFPFEEHITYEETTLTDLLIADIVAAFWIMLNFWLSYKLFCRTQLKAKWVNI